jgi:4-hydroxy-4-methyl-2-oxoglutarate aldolase
MTDTNWVEIAERFKKLYVPAVCDVLDEYQLMYQFSDHGIHPLNRDLKVAGPAYTVVGMSCSITDRTKRIGPTVIDNFRAGVVACYDTMGDQKTGVWGELWSAGARRAGAVGAVVDGGIRDTAYIRAAGFPMFYRFTAPGDALGRFSIVDYECPVTMGGVRVNPGDYVFADEDGVVFIPKELMLEVLVKAEKICEIETQIRAALAKEKTLATLYTEFGRF